MARTAAEWAAENFQPWPCERYEDAAYAAWFIVCHAADVDNRPIPKDSPWWQEATSALTEMIWKAASEANNARLEQERRGEIIYTLWTCHWEDGEERGYNVEPAGSTGWLPPGPHWTCVGTVDTEREALEWCRSPH